jgi:hypothetical protein
MVGGARMTELNVNDRVRVRLTPSGLHRLNIYYAAFKQKPRLDGEFYESSLWELMAIFGQLLHMGMTEIPFVDNRIEVLK